LITIPCVKRRAKGSLNYSLLREILSDWLKILSPIMPHTAEEFWQKLGNKDFISLSEWPKAETRSIREDVESAEQLVQTVSKDIEHSYSSHPSLSTVAWR
jgi:leucyl-tRNA synthetase